MAEAIVGPVLGKLQELAVSEARAMVAVDNDIRSLRDKLMWLQAFLREAEPRRRVLSDEIMKVWLHQTRDAAFDAEDAIDQYSLQVDLSRYPNWTRATLRFFANFTTQLCVRRNLSTKIEVINSRLEDIIKNKDKYKIEGPASTSVVAPWRASTSFNVFQKWDGFNDPPWVRPLKVVQRLRDELFGEKPHLAVIFVTGESGIGKTTLVRNLYKDPGTRNHFEVQAMESFAPYLSADNIMQLILRQLKDDEKMYTKEKVRKGLRAELEGKKYLLVIDGEVISTEWKNILSALPDEDKFSRVVRITQAKPFETDHDALIEVEHLDENATKKLFLKRVCLEEKYMKHIIGYIHEITQGLPLAIVLLSGLLRTKESDDESMNVIRELLASKQSKWFDNIMSLCFDDLPHDLKSCFLYFAAFPANAMIEARGLVCMWMAEGFLRAKEGVTMEKLGFLYLNELVARNLVNIGQLNDFSSEGSKLVGIQSKVHDFLKLEAHEASFVEVYGGDDIPAFKTARRLSLPNHIDKYAALASPLPKLRSILCHLEQEVTAVKKAAAHELTEGSPCLCYSRHKINSKEHVQSYIRTLLEGSEFLRVIKLHGLEIGEKLPSEIGNVVHLRYLGVTSCSLREIPSCIGKLNRLETLDVRGTKVRKLSPAFWRITTLRHVFGYKLILPRRVGVLKHLQSLETIELHEEKGWDGETLKRMIRLQSLFIRKLSKGNSEALSAALERLEFLVFLTLHGEGEGKDDYSIPSAVFTTTALVRLKFMKLDGMLQRFPHQPNDITSCLPNLKILSLRKTRVQQAFIDMLATLPSLAILALYTDSYQDDCLRFSVGGFRSLNKLRIIVKGLKRVDIPGLALPKIEGIHCCIYGKLPEINIPGRNQILNEVEAGDEEPSDEENIPSSKIVQVT